jgi:rhodanese-related sulfurtransferase
MSKQTIRMISLLTMLSLALSACSAVSGVLGTSVTTGQDGTALPSGAKTAIASVVSQAGTATQKAGAGTPIIAGATTGTPGANAKTTPGSGTSRATQVATTPGATSSAPLGTAASTPSSTLASTPIPATPASNPGTMKPTMDWTTPWATLLRTLPPDYYTISVDELSAELNSANPPFLLDVREVSEIDQYGYIEGAVNIPYRSVLTNLDKLPAQDQPIVVYSGEGHRGTIILSALRLVGYTNARLLDGGASAWQKAKQPVQQGQPNPPVSMSSPSVNQNMVTDLNNFIDTGTYGVSPQELSSWMATANKPIVVDVRERTETATRGAIAGSVQIPLPTLFDNLNEIPNKNSAIVIIDSTGHRGAMAMMALRMIGYTNVRSVFGGYEAWVAAGLPVIR